MTVTFKVTVTLILWKFWKLFIVKPGVEEIIKLLPADFFCNSDEFFGGGVAIFVTRMIGA